MTDEGRDQKWFPKAVANFVWQLISYLSNISSHRLQGRNVSRTLVTLFSEGCFGPGVVVGPLVFGLLCKGFGVYKKRKEKVNLMHELTIRWGSVSLSILITLLHELKKYWFSWPLSVHYLVMKF